MAFIVEVKAFFLSCGVRSIIDGGVRDEENNVFDVGTAADDRPCHKRKRDGDIGG